MDLKKKMKAFFTLKRRANDGFTLVELIVVIAILAILGGVAVPAYSGYVKKAEYAADEQLLGAINTAFAAACLANGESQTGRTDANLVLNADKTVKSVSTNEKIQKSFVAFFTGNETSVFKGSYTFTYNSTKGLFEMIPVSDTRAVQLGDKTYYISQSIIDAVSKSSYGKNITAMQNQLSGIAGAFAGVIGNVETAGIFSPGLQEFMNKNGYKDADLGNAAVLYIAQTAGDYDAQDVADLFQNCENYIGEYYQQHGENPAMGDIINGAFGEGEDGLVNAALMYGAVTAYANSDQCKDPTFKTQVANISDGTQLVNLLMGLKGNTEWSNYLGTGYDSDGNGVNDRTAAGPQFTTDMNGFFGAMDAINTVSPSVDTDNSNYWKEDEDINKLLEELLGNK